MSDRPDEKRKGKKGAEPGSGEAESTEPRPEDIASALDAVLGGAAEQVEAEANANANANADASADANANANANADADADAARQEAEATERAIEESLSAVFGGDADEAPSGGGEDAEGADAPGGSRPRLKLDKTGALADRPKLQPKRPYARPGERPAPEDAVSAFAGADPATPARKATLPPPIGTIRPPDWQDASRVEKPPDDEVAVAGGTFLYGEEQETREVGGFRIDRHPVTNAEYDAFVRATGHRPPLYWPNGQVPEDLADHPVVGVDYFDALAYAQWKGKDLPFEDEWERAARGTDGRTYPWGNDPELGQANTARLGHKTTVPIGWYEMNTSPDGMRDAVGNVWEITHSPAPGGGIVVRGGSWYDFVLYAKTWFRFASRPEARNGTIGFRCVRRTKERPDAPREVDPNEVLDAIEDRQGPQPSFDRSAFSSEKRDLVPDHRRLRAMVSEREAEEAHARDAKLFGRIGAVTERPTRAPKKATPPPPIKSSPPPVEPAPSKPAEKSAAKPEPESVPEPEPEPRPTPKPERKPESAPKPSPPAKEPAPSVTQKRPAASVAPKTESAKEPSPVTRSRSGAGAGAGEAADADAKPPAEKKMEPAAKAGAKQSDAAPLDKASLEHATTMAARGAVGNAEDEDAPREPEMPLGYWLAVGGGIALVLTLLVLLVTGALSRDDGGDATPWTAGGTGNGGDVAKAEPPAPPPTGPPPLVARPMLPDVSADDPRDDEPPTWIDGLAADDPAAIDEGVWLLVFSEAPIAERRRTVRTANEVHRKMRDLGARLAIVLPREHFVGEGGRLLPIPARRARLRAIGASSDVTVFLDRPVGPPLGGALRARYGVSEPQAAIVIVDGRLEHRTAPPSGGFTLSALEPLAVRATEIRPR